MFGWTFEFGSFVNSANLPAGRQVLILTYEFVGWSLRIT